MLKINLYALHFMLKLRETAFGDAHYAAQQPSDHFDI
jgi:hypothetical protein